MHTFPDLIDKLGGPAAVARAAGAEPNAARQWKRRKCIPGLYWPQVLSLAQEKNVDVSLPMLADLAKKTRDENLAKAKRRKRKLLRRTAA